MPKPFVLNDENVANMLGFKVKNSGIDLTRFKANPVMLDFHIRGTKNVIGRWENIRIEGSQLLADPVFDEADEEAMKIKGKVDRGFVKGASLGLDIRFAQWELDPVTDIPVLTFCSVIEASIVDIPSNEQAIRLYGESGELSPEQVDIIKLSVNELISNQINNTNKMKQIQLSVAALLVLNLQADQLKDNTAIEAAIEKLAKDHQQKQLDLTAMTRERDQLQLKLKAISESNVNALVDDAVKSGKITADKKESFVKFAISDFDTAKGILDGIPSVASLAAQAKGGKPAGSFDAVKSLDDFEKLSLDDKVAFKTSEPDKYKSLFV